MTPPRFVPRHLSGPILRTLRHFPVAGITGARQVGKSTLAQSLISDEWPAVYMTLDDRAALTAALQDPEGFIEGNPPPLILDEVQRAPALLLALKGAVDRHRRPGSYLVTGSANLLTLKRVSETLAGRAVYHELLPLSWSELAGRQSPAAVIDSLFEVRGAREFITRWTDLVEPQASRQELAARILAGGYPDAALTGDPWVRRQWFEGYRQTYLTRDVRDLAAVEHMPAFDRLLVTTALRTGQILNQSELARDLGVPYSTLRRYLSLLDLTYQVWFLRPYHMNNPGLRLVKSPKLYHMDTGLAAYLAAMDDWAAVERQGRQGQLFETWVAGELKKALPLCARATSLWFWASHQGREVDFVLERGADVVGIEAKWGAEVDRAALRGLTALKAAAGRRFRMGVVVHTGPTMVALAEDIVAVPVHVLLGGIP